MSEDGITAALLPDGSLKINRPGRAAVIWFRELDLRCVRCGKQRVWMEGEGDYYVGPEHICADCGAVFTLPTQGDAPPEIFRALRAAEPLPPQDSEREKP